MEANPEEDPKLAEQARRARMILLLCMAVGVGLPLVLFVIFHKN